MFDQSQNEWLKRQTNVCRLVVDTGEGGNLA
jgi:hypothetical protein